MLYHVSHEAGLKVLKPHVSTHKKAYVYAINNLVTGLLFGAKQDDFDFIISTDENDKPIMYECYPDAFKKVYQGKGCSAYVVSEEGFLRNMTSWSPELVCETEVPVLEEIVIEDLYQKILEEEAQGNIQIHRYEFNDTYRKKISSHIVDRLIRFDMLDNDCLDHDERFTTHFKRIVEALQNAADGHLLQ